MRRLIAAFALLAAPALAVDWKSLPKPTGYVSDLAGVIDPASAAALEEYAGRVEQATGAQLCFVTLPSLQGEPIENVANDLFRAWGIGHKKEDDGVMELFAIQDRKSRLEVGGGVGGAVPDGMAGLLLDDMRPALRAGQYGEAMLVAAEQIGSAIAQSKGVAIPPPQYRSRTPRSTNDRIPWPSILIGVFILMLVLRGGGGGGFWTGLLLSQLLGGGGGYGRREGGGFGGFDGGGGGGGFGGFGGGSSGGGGASGSW